MNNEKICPVYSASDNTARKCIKEECGWWCDQCNACAVVSVSDSDIYVLYYTPGAESVEELTFMYNEAKKSRSTETYHRITYQPLAQRNIKTRTLEYYLQNSVQR